MDKTIKNTNNILTIALHPPATNKSILANNRTKQKNIYNIVEIIILYEERPDNIIFLVCVIPAAKQQHIKSSLSLPVWNTWNNQVSPGLK